MSQSQHLAFRGKSSPSLTQRKDQRSLSMFSEGVASDSDTMSRRDKVKNKYLSKDKEKRSSVNHEKKKHMRSSSSLDALDMLDFHRSPESPVTYLLEELRKVAPEGTTPTTFPSLLMTDIFSIWTRDQLTAYDKESIAAIRDRDIDLLRSWHKNGRTLQAANNFGESLLHMACRRGFLDVVQFLVDECGHDLWIRDDTGRTPLHDACWTAKPCPELVEYILSKDCDMLLVSDKRGHTPLDYASKDHWDFWIEHLKQMDMKGILPKLDIFYTHVFASISPNENEDTIQSLESAMSELNTKSEGRLCTYVISAKGA